MVHISSPTAHRKQSNCSQGKFIGEIQGIFSNFSHFSQFLAKMAVFRGDLEVRRVQYFESECKCVYSL